MAIFDLFGDTTGLPKTTRTGIPYEIDALTPKEQWGAGNGSTTIGTMVKWAQSTSWIRDMVGEVSVLKTGSVTPTYFLKRFLPEKVQFTDGRPHWCSMVAQTDQGGNPNNDAGERFAIPLTNWPRTRWAKYQAVFEVFPYALLTDLECDDITSAAGARAGPRELLRYVIRSRRVYAREQPIPSASTAGGFKVVDDAVAANRKPVGQIGFRVIEFADVTYKWVRVPIGWPPPVGWDGGTVENPWPPKFNPVAADTTKERARDAYIGTINDDWFDAAAPDGYAFPPGTLLYTGYDDSNRYYDAAGDWVCDVTFNFKFKGGRDADGLRGGWNYFLDSTGKWKLVSLTGTSAGTKPYRTNSFNNLFQYAAS